ncbi:MAG: esterase/lipase family protein [Alphaproteobacteria bacterium]
MATGKQPSSTKTPDHRRRYLRGGLVAAFAAAVLGGGVAWHATAPDSPYLHPRAAQAYHIPDQSCALTTMAALPEAPRGNGAPVLLLPGFLSSDRFMQPLANKISAAGYTTYGWDLGVNTGITPDLAAALQARLETIAQNHPGQKITLIGYSLGGVYARELARNNPDRVAQVMTLGAPFALTDKNGTLDPILSRTFSTFNTAPEATGDTRSPLPVPTTSIFGTQDRIVNWRASLNAGGTDAENIPVVAGHLSLRHSAQAADIILHRLAETPATGWQPLARKFCAPQAS